MGLLDTLGMQPGQQAPPDIDPQLLAQIMGLGSVDQRHKLLQQNLARADQTAEGVPIDYSKGKGTPLLLAGLANLVSSGVGGYQAGKAQAGEKALIDEQNKGRSDFAKTLLSASQPTPDVAAPGAAAGFVGPPAPGNDYASVDSKRQGLLSTLQSIGLMSGDPTVAAAVKAGPQLALEKQKLANEGPQEALGGMTTDVFKAKTAAEKVPEVAVNPLNGALYDKRTGKNVTNGSGAASSLTPEALDQLAEMFHTTGQLPPVGRGPSAALTIKSIVNRAAELHPDANLAGNKAGFGADAASLKKLQTSADSIDAFESTAIKNLDQLDKAAQKVVDSGLPVLNTPLRSLDNSVLGDPKMSAFNAARQTAVQEVGKVLGGAVAGGAISDSQRHEVEGLLSGDMTLPQIRAAIAQLKTDMVNRKTSVQEQLGTIRARASGAAAKPAADAAPAAKTQAPPQNDRDSQAVQMARERLKANPNDATALQVLKVNGVQP